MKEVINIVKEHNGRQGGLIAILEDIQNRYGYLPEETLRKVTEETGCSMVDIYGVATFYKAFRLKPRGKHLVTACQGTACHVRGAPAVIEEFEKSLGISVGETTPDKEFTLETVNCLGACALGPIVVVDGHYFPKVSKKKVSTIIDRVHEGLDKIDIKKDRRIFPLEVSCPRCNHGLMDPGHPIEGYPSIKVTVSFERMHGWLRMSSLYGSYTIESGSEIPEDTIVNFFCPHCHAELNSDPECSTCGAPMIPMAVRGGGMVFVCSRQGCKGHMLDLGELSV